MATRAIYWMFSKKTQTNPTEGKRKTIPLCWFGSFTRGSVLSVNPQPQWDSMQQSHKPQPQEMTETASYSHPTATMF